MPRKIKDPRIRKGKSNRNKQICSDFDKLYSGGLRYEVVLEKLVLTYGLSESTIMQIVKKQGYYKQ